MKAVPEFHNFPKSEEEILKYWEKIDAFQESYRRSVKENRPIYSFYDGPPFATGLPHYGHILAGTIKDIVTRYAHMTGHQVERRFGWDCHGLPIEFEIDKEKGIKTKQDVLSFGIANYNEECRKIVMRYSAEWEKTVTRLGRWIDFKNDYKTMDLKFMESVWWVFSEIYKKGLVYRAFKVMPYSTKCTTPLSNFEANMAYQNVNDPSVVVSFPLVSDPTKNLVAWTTTPWTLPSNLALCVHPDLNYLLIKDNKTGQQFYIQENLTSTLYKKPDMFTVVETVKGKDLEGLEYVPLFDYFKNAYPNAFKVVCDTYVTNTSGTGIVHQAPGFGEDDFRVCTRENVCSTKNVLCPINDDGKFTNEIPELSGMYFKDADKVIIKKLKDNGRLLKNESINHSYPFCWRSDTPLIYKAVPSWFISVSSIKERLLENNKMTYWVPDYVKEKRFHNWLHDARDWAISRNRFWGTPLPIWVSEDYEEIVVIGSIKELEELSGKKITDLHRHYIDDIEIPSKQGKGMLRRVPEVFDCWFESGSMPYAQQHYPFENVEKFEKSFPANFIAEGLDQTRGWFYTLLVISTALFDKPPFKNLIVNGLVLAEDKKKMSKRLKNYPDPTKIIDSYGADALRLYLINSPVVHAEVLIFREKGVKDVIKDLLNKWYNAYKLFVDNVIRSENEGRKFNLDKNIIDKTTNVMDKWILASCQSLIKFVRAEMAAYRLYTVIPKLVSFIEDLTNWYARFNRDRMKGKYGNDEETYSLSTMALVLLDLCRTMAPFTPFFVEVLYQNLKQLLPKEEQEESVHFLSFPEVDSRMFNDVIERQVSRMREVIELSRTAREASDSPLRKPLRKLYVYVDDDEYAEDIMEMKDLILSELKIKEIEVKKDSEEVQISAIPNFQTLGKRLKKEVKSVSEAIKKLSHDELKSFAKTGSIEVLGHVLTKEDLKVVKNFNEAAVASKDRKFYPCSNQNILIVLDITKEEELETEHFIAEVLNRIQRLRKKASLKLFENDILGFYDLKKMDDKEVTDEKLASLKEIIRQKHSDIFKKTNTKLYYENEKESFSGSVHIESLETDLIMGVQMQISLHREKSS